ncbi:DNA polymerase III subunit theta [Klebsiella aerogenes]|uniref:DNA polymerase III subunit theta n=1 Tax=Klebsiella aerogenes TaxID=548 RepID=UPI0021D032D5|nr:DNA polymerase III subunit theta [Klebsiella aerogenes]MCU6317463.1 DNA polymerase III subunit theta [Klebsiella aerogenes]
MSDWNIAAKPQDERDKVNVDLADSGVAYKERLNMPVIAEVVMREQPHEYQEYFLERLHHYREISLLFPKVSDTRYVEMAEKSSKI